MPRPAKGVRLYPYRRKGREPVYIIRDGAHSESTKCGLDDIAGANKKLADYLEKTFRPDTGQRDLSKINVAEVLMLYGRDIAPSKASAATIGFHIKTLSQFWGDKTLADVKGSTCRAYLNSRSGNITSRSTPDSNGGSDHWTAHSEPTKAAESIPVKSSTVRRELKTLSAAINHWHRESPLAAVPEVTMPPDGARRERYLERNEAAALLRAARKLGAKHVVRFIIIGLYTGTRHTAILRLRWSPNLGGGNVDVERGVIYRRGTSEPETSKRRPPVKASRRLLAHLERWRRADGLAWPSTVVHYKGQRIAKIRRAWATVVKSAGLGKDVTPHVLRHTFCTWELWKGRSPFDVGGDAGADSSTIERVYGHHRPVSAANLRRVG